MGSPRKYPTPAAGERFGRLVVMTGVEERYQGTRAVECRCDCGTERLFLLHNLCAGKSLSCGCLWDERRGTGQWKHGDCGTRLHALWLGIRQRCRDPKLRIFRYYGGRGITICPEWEGSYEAFRDWAKANGFADDLEIDRIDNNGNYEPRNCRFVTKTENLRNKRTNRLMTAFGETKCLSAWATDPRCVVKYGTLWFRLNKGWGPEEALTRNPLVVDRTV